MKKQHSLIILSVLLIIFFAGCSKGPGSSNVFRSISPKEAIELIRSDERLVVIDVRSPKELREGYIEGSVFIPIWEIAQGKKDLPVDRPLLLVCAIGGRSYGLGKYLNEKGWPEIYNLSGGISAWKKAGLPLKY